jgi:hypothetical protein
MKFRALLISSAFLMAACTSSATISGSAVKATTPASVQLKAGANAASDVSDITNRPNPPVRKGQTPTQSVAPVQRVQPQVTVPSQATPTLRDRCMNETGRPGKQPLPMCAPA